MISNVSLHMSTHAWELSITMISTALSFCRDDPNDRRPWIEREKVWWSDGSTCVEGCIGYLGSWTTRLEMFWIRMIIWRNWQKRINPVSLFREGDMICGGRFLSQHKSPAVSSSNPFAREGWSSSWAACRERWTSTILRVKGSYDEPIHGNGTMEQERYA